MLAMPPGIAALCSRRFVQRLDGKKPNVQPQPLLAAVNSISCADIHAAPRCVLGLRLRAANSCQYRRKYAHPGVR
jgi:hypothetical protein